MDGWLKNIQGRLTYSGVMVTGIVGRADLLACLFFLLSLLFFHSSISSSHTATLSTFIKLFLSLLLGAAAMLSKEHGATVLGVCMVYDVIVIHRRSILRCFKERRFLSPSLHPLYLRSFLLLATTALLLGVRVWLLHGHLPHFSVQDNPASFSESLVTRVLTYCYLFYFNAKLLVYPWTLCYDWQMGSIPLLETLSDPRNIGTLFFFISLLSLVITSLCGRGFNGHRRVMLLGLCLLVIPFLPATNIFLRVGFVVAERILYIPSLGYCVLVAQGLHSLSKKLTKSSSSHLAISLTLLLAAIFSLKTVTRNRIWATRESLFRSGLATVPDNSKVHYNYANFLKDAGRLEEAVRHYKESIKLSPDHAVSHNNLGTLLEGEEAEFHFREAVKHNPQHYKAFYNLGRNLEKQGRVWEAQDALRKSLEIKPDYEDALMSLATLLGDAGMLDEGLTYIQRAVESSGQNPDVYNNLGAYFLRLDRSADAIEAYLKAISLETAHTTAMTNLARVYRQRGENEKAEEMFKRSLSMRPDVDTLYYLGSFYHNTGRLREAAAAFQDALRLHPHKTDTSCALAQTLMLLEQNDQAISVLQAALPPLHSSTPTLPCVHINLANAYLKLKHLKKALEHSNKAIELSTSNSSKADAYHMRGGIQKDLGQMKEAQRSFESAVELNPTKAVSRLNLGAMLHLNKDYAGARREYEAALKLEPSNQLLLDNLKKLERLERTSKS